MIQNMTTGSPAKLILTFSLPLLIGNLFQQMYNISDILIVGRLLGVNALAAIGASAPIYFIFLLIVFGFTGGLTVITAQKFGAGDFNGMRKSITHCIRANIALSILMSIFLGIFLHPLLKLLNVPSEIMDDAYNFMIILTAGLVLLGFYNLLAGFIRALGDSKTPLYFLMFSTVLNIALNITFIYGLGMGVAGSALGTVTAIGLAVVLCLGYIHKKFPIMHLKKADWIYDSQFMKQHLIIAIPMALQFSILSVGMMIIQSICNSFGPEVITGFTAALRIEQLAMQPLLALGISMATYVAQNWGAGKISRIRRGVTIATLSALSFSIIISLAVRFIGRDMIAVFLKDENAYIVEIGRAYLSISTLFYFFLGMIFVFRNTLQGMGKSLIPLLGGFIELIMRSFAAVYLAKTMGYKGIFYASPIAWLGAALVLMVGYVVVMRDFKAKNLKAFFKNNASKIKLTASVNQINHSPAE